MNDFIRSNIITIWVATFVLEALMGMLAQSIAEKKGHPKRWFWAGFFLSVVGVAWAAGLPDEIVRRRLNLSIPPATRSEPPPEDLGKPHAPPETLPGHSDEGELAAVLSAAVAAMGEGEGKKFVLRSFRRSPDASTAWNKAGRSGRAAGG